MRAQGQSCALVLTSVGEILFRPSIFSRSGEPWVFKNLTKTAKSGFSLLKDAFRPFTSWEVDIAMRYLRAKKEEGGVALISVISFFGIMLAVMVLIIVMSVMNGFRAELLERILGFNGHAYVAGQALSLPDREVMLKRIENLPEVKSLSPMVESPGLAISRSGQASLAYMRAISPKAIGQMPIVAKNMVAGTTKGFGDGEYGGDRILIGDGLAQTMGVVVGDDLTLMSPSGGSTPFGSTPRKKSYLVSGIFRSGVSELDASFVFMPLEQGQLFFGKDGQWDIVELMLKNPDPEAVQVFMKKLRHEAGSQALTLSWMDRQSAYWDALNIEKNVMRLILMLVVAIAMMNIISGLVMLVKNKGRDIAILKTMGATRGSILRVFFLSGATIGTLGTLAGLILGLLICIYIQPIQTFLEWMFQAKLFNAKIYYLSHLPARIEAGEVTFVALFSLLTSSLVTIFPALSASRLDPVEGLRYE